MRQLFVKAYHWTVHAALFATLVLAPSVAFAQDGDDKKRYAVQWAIVTMLTFLAFLVLCKPAFREEKIKKDRAIRDRSKSMTGGAKSH